MLPFARRAAWLAIGLGLVSGAGCEEERPPLFQAAGSAGSGGAGGFALDSGAHDGPPDPDASGLCGNLILPVQIDKPNLYFVVDRSGSMDQTLPDTQQTKFYATRYAIAEALKAIGHRVRYGAAVFPVSGGEIEGCAPGVQVFETRDGDPPTYAAAGELGPILNGLMVTLAKFGPTGGTPTASTLAALYPTLTALPGKTFVVLATDGAPNCNANAVCSATGCQHTIEGTSVNGKSCTDTFNCCDPALVPGGQLYCVDDDATEAAVIALAQAGIDTYVIGMPGTEYYGDVLDRLALAGNTARPGPPYYYSTESNADLIQSLFEIGIQVAVSCTVNLGQEPPDPALVNVYFDTALVGQDDTDGWAWIDSTTIEIRGAACDQLKSGNVLQVQVVSGCPTFVR